MLHAVVRRCLLSEKPSRGGFKRQEPGSYLYRVMTGRGRHIIATIDAWSQEGWDQSVHAGATTGRDQVNERCRDLTSIWGSGQSERGHKGSKC